MSLRLIQQYRGHSSLMTTTRYLHLTTRGQEDAFDTMEKLMVVVERAARRLVNRARADETPGAVQAAR